MNPVVRRFFAHQGACPTGSQAVATAEGLRCASRGPYMVGDALSPKQPVTKCGVGDFFADREHNDVATFTHAASYGTFAAVLGFGGAAAGLVLAGRPISGAVLGVAAGAGVAAYKYEKWKADGGTSGMTGSCP